MWSMGSVFRWSTGLFARCGGAPTAATTSTTSKSKPRTRRGPAGEPTRGGATTTGESIRSITGTYLGIFLRLCCPSRVFQPGRVFTSSLSCCVLHFFLNCTDVVLRFLIVLANVHVLTVFLHYFKFW